MIYSVTDYIEESLELAERYNIDIKHVIELEKVEALNNLAVYVNRLTDGTLERPGIAESIIMASKEISNELTDLCCELEDL